MAISSLLSLVKIRFLHSPSLWLFSPFSLLYVDAKRLGRCILLLLDGQTIKEILKHSLQFSISGNLSKDHFLLLLGERFECRKENPAVACEVAMEYQLLFLLPRSSLSPIICQRFGQSGNSTISFPAGPKWGNLSSHLCSGQTKGN